ncbi:hypothetical protein [Paraburkholderia unamae]|uniref:Uncharacterized protein n=1 Tax=Paraburkholderia unamae TaxID=219649 RepID=A0ABX5KHV5_9BURK|nr:hypothetical protein [Paraburkholderia unamae]PVX80024.1 hypothetical protein C7402_112211 [Paraburkholderia unamae]
MARKPAHLELIGGRGPRQRIWEAIRKRRDGFEVTDIERATKADRYTIYTYVQGLAKGGFIEHTNKAQKRFAEKLYKLVRDVGVEAPRLDKKGNVLRTTGNENMWRTMRIIGDFTAAELAMRASTSETTVAEATAKKYLQLLCVAGYITVIEMGHSRQQGVAAKATRYRLLQSKYTGPRPPMIQSTKSLYDPNIGKIVWQEEPDHDAC